MLPKPRAINGIGIVQFFLAAAFVIWLLIFPNTATKFAWPITPAVSAMFIGVGFLLRTFLGYHLWREKQWYRLRWIVWGNYMFLAVIFLATFWHLSDMNWKSSLLVAHIWVVAYVVEPLVLTLVEPRGPEANAPLLPELSQGAVLQGLRLTLAAIYIVGITVGGMLLINPQFADTRWPWPLDPFDARIMAAVPAACAVWAATMYFKKDWAEIKMGVQALIVYIAALFVLWIVTFSQYDPARKNGLTFGVAAGLMTAVLVFFYWRQEVARRTRGASDDGVRSYSLHPGEPGSQPDN